jgi:hypothetical protein
VRQSGLAEVTRPWLVIAWGVLVLTLVDGAYSVVLSSYLPHQEIHSDYKPNEDEHSLDGPIVLVLRQVFHAVERRIDVHEKFLLVLSTVAIAFFTYTLWRATTKLQEAAERQIEDTQKALAIGKQSADAAMLSAQSAISLERPTIMLYRLDFGDMGTANWDAMLQWPKIEVSVKNYGRTPAFIQSLAVEIVCGITLPDEPDYSEHAFDVPPETVIEAKANFDLGATRPHQLTLLEDIEAIKEERKFLWVYGYVQYLDFLGDRHIMRFCKQLLPNGGILGRRYRFIDCYGNPKYIQSA